MSMLRKTTLLVVALTVSNSLNAQDAPKRGAGARPGISGRGEGMQAGQRMGIMPLMKALDADQDGTISAAEIQNASKALAALDKNNDGSLSGEELRPDMSALAGGDGRPGQPGAPGRPGAGGGAPSREMMSRMFEMRDADKDGKLSGDEIPERMRQNIERMDKNSDGALDKSELEQAMARMAEQGGRQPGGRKTEGREGGEGVTPKRPSAE
ncbi:MAG UNVERIFIED_CONTAM: hypothetical protein LVR18_29150 [Planctomycetaceae bacterium]